MENSLDNQFDQFIKGSLEDLQAPYDPSTWDALEHKLDQAMAPEIDTVARLAMADLAVPYNPASWDALEQKMDQVTAQEVDSTARQAVSNLTVPYNAATWQVLSDRLDRIDYRRKLIALKLVEAALILLALITAVRFIHQVPNKQKAPQVEQQQMAILSDSPQSELIDEAGSKNVQHSTIPSTADNVLRDEPQGFEANAQTAGILKNNLSIGIEKDSKVPTSRGEQTNSQAKTRKVYASRAVERRPIHVEAQRNKLSAKADQEKTDWQRTMAPLANLSGKELEVRTPKSRLTRAQMKETLVGIPTLDVRTIMHEDMPISYAIAAPRLRKVKSLTTRLGVYRQVSDHVVTQQFGRGVVKSQTVKNGAVGIIASVQSGKLGFDFGLAYEKLLVNGEGYINEVSFQNELHMIQVPLNLRVVPISNRYFDFYLKGGASAHGAIYALYEEPVTTAAGIRNAYNEKFNAGLLNAESNYKEQNIYYTINYGVGLEVKAFENWSIFLEGILQDHHKGTLGWKGMEIKSRSYKVGINRTL